MNNIPIFKKGFTIIELLAVIAIIAILVLLASPSILGKKEKAELAHIKADIKTTQSAVGAYLLKHESLEKKVSDGENIGFEEFSVNSEKIYSVRGEFNGDVYNDGSLYDVSSLIDSTLKKKGVFVANQEGIVYYVKGASVENSPPVGEPNPESDFVWISDEYGYEFKNKNGTGYWKYNGEKKNVVIPEKIDGETLKSYYKMFSESKGITKVSSLNKEVTSFVDMFYGASSDKNSTLDLNQLESDNVQYLISMFGNYEGGNIDMKKMKTSHWKNMNSMFLNSKIENLHLPLQNKSSIESVIQMFSQSEAKNIDFGQLDLSKVQNASFLFSKATAENIYFRKTKFEETKEMNFVFRGLKYKGERLDLSSFNLSKVESFTQAFRETEAKEIFFGENFNLQNVEDLQFLFLQSKISNLNLGSFNLKKAKKLDFMFSKAEINNLNFGENFGGDNLESLEFLFSESKIKKLNTASLKTLNVTNFIGVFDNSEIDEISFGENFNTESGVKMNLFFYKLKTKGDLILPPKFTTKKAKDLGVFASETTVEGELDFGDSIVFDFNNDLTHGATFVNLSAKNIKIGEMKFINANDEDIRPLFQSVSADKISIKNLEFSGKTRSIKSLFGKKIEEIVIEKLSFIDAENLDNVFADLKAKSMTINNFSAEKAKSTETMFRGSKIDELRFNNVSIGEIENIHLMFLQFEGTIYNLSWLKLANNTDYSYAFTDFKGKIIVRNQSEKDKLSEIFKGVIEIQNK